MDSNQLRLLNQKLTDLIKNDIRVVGNNEISINGRRLKFSTEEPQKELNRKTTLSR